MQTQVSVRSIARLSLLILLASSLNILRAQRLTVQERAAYETRCNAERAADRGEPDAAKDYSSSRLLLAKRSWIALWVFLDAPDTTYPERLAAAYQGGDLVTAGAFPTIWTALADSKAAGEGATLRQDLDDNAALYGKKLENRDIVTKEVRAPKAATKLIALLNRYSFRERRT
jgi:hypothetical protein